MIDVAVLIVSVEDCEGADSEPSPRTARRPVQPPCVRFTSLPDLPLKAHGLPTRAHDSRRRSARRRSTRVRIRLLIPCERLPFLSLSRHAPRKLLRPVVQVVVVLVALLPVLFSKFSIGRRRRLDAPLVETDRPPTLLAQTRRRDGRFPFRG